MRGLIIFCLVSSLSTVAWAQSPFEGGLVLGGTLSQVDGDAYSGYRRVGLEMGMKGIVRFHERFYLSVQWLYSERGARPSAKEQLRDFNNYINIGVAYAEVPILLHLAPGFKKGDYYPVELFTGVSVARLIRTNIREEGVNVSLYPYLGLNEIKDSFEKTDISFLVGGQYNLNRRWSIYVKHTLALRPLYTPTSALDPYNILEPFYISAGVNYVWR